MSAVGAGSKVEVDAANARNVRERLVVERGIEAAEIAEENISVRKGKGGVSE